MTRPTSGNLLRTLALGIVLCRPGLPAAAVYEHRAPHAAVGRPAKLATVRAGMAAMSQIDRSLDEAAATLRASAFRALTTIVLPLLKPAIVTALVYSFVRAMTTVSAVVFLVSAEYEMATVFVINRVINGDYGIAIATCAVLIALMTIVIALVQRLVGERRLDQPGGQDTQARSARAHRRQACCRAGLSRATACRPGGRCAAGCRCGRIIRNF